MKLDGIEFSKHVRAQVVANFDVLYFSINGIFSTELCQNWHKMNSLFINRATFFFQMGEFIEIPFLLHLLNERH